MEISRPNLVDEDLISDSESSTTNEESVSLFGSGFIKLEEDDTIQQVIKHKFISDLGKYGLQTDIEVIHRRSCAANLWKSKIESFMCFFKDIEKKNGGNPNWKYAWYCGSKQDIINVISNGFGHSVNTGLYGRGVYLSPVQYPLQSWQDSSVDEDGLRHLLLCRVILGRSEMIHPASNQCHPSSDEFDSGVDKLDNPTKYVIWSTHMDTHIMPEFIISIRVPQEYVPKRKQNSPLMPFQTLISTLEKYLTPDKISLIQKHHIDHRIRRITREELIRRVRQITGDELLVRVIKSYKNEQLDISNGGGKPIRSVKYNNQKGGVCGCSNNGPLE